MLGLDAGNAALQIAIAVLVLLVAGAIECGERHADGAGQPVVPFEVMRTVVLGSVLLVALSLHPVHGVDFLLNAGDAGRPPTWYGAALARPWACSTITGFETCAGLGEEGVNVRFRIPRGVTD